MYSLDFRRLALSIFKKLQNYRKCCSLLSISLSTLHRWVKVGIKPKVRTQFSYRKVSDLVKSVIIEALSTNAFLTLSMLQNIVKATQKITITLSSVIKKLGFSKKKAYLKIKPNVANHETKLKFSAQFLKTNKSS